MGFEILSLGRAADQNDSSLHLGQHARLHGKPGLFVVVGLNCQRETVDLIASTGISRVVPHVPFSQVHPLHLPHLSESTQISDFEARTLPFPS